MLCSHGLQSAFSPFMDSSWPVHSLRMEVRPLLYQQHLLQRSLKELCSSLEMMDKLQHNNREQTQSSPSSQAEQATSYQLERDGRSFNLRLDTGGFSPEELSVRLQGRKLRVSGKKEKKQEDGKGWSSYNLQEFREEFDLPEGLDPESLSCCLSPDGKLHIQAAKVPQVEEAERELKIKRSSEEESQQSVCSQAGENSTETHSNTQEQPANMD